ncbi:amidohydrolase family protein [Blastococcus aggregatus]|nr:amidohydrolase family protein [Blastococcus aggregatus]
MLVDCHVHVGARDRWIPEGLRLADQLAAPEVREVLAGGGPTGDRLLAYLDSQGVDVAVAIPSGREPVQEYALDEAVGTDRILPFVQYDPRSAPDASRRFAAAIDAGARGLKVHPMSHQLPANDRSLYPLFAIAEERRIPVMVHVGSSVFPGAKMRFCDPLLVDEVAADFPDLQVLCAHSGRGFWTQQVFELTRMRGNVWMELSGLPARRIAALFPELDRVGDRVLFGSDWPSSPAISRLAKEFRGLPFSEELTENVLWRNACRLFGLKPPTTTDAK